jgi:type II restriction enzyme
LPDLLRVCEPLAAREYPRNHHVAAKLRQQLQVLRNLGLVEFVRRGVYRRTMV